MELIRYFFFPFASVIFILFLCKWFNFSIIPEGMKLPAPDKFELPRLKRNEVNYKWEINEEDEEDYE